MKKFLLLICALIGTVGAWAQITVSPSTGKYWKGGAQSSDSWAPQWKSNAKTSDGTTSLLVFTGETGMNTATGDIYSNQSYTLEAPTGYKIVSYTFNGTATEGDVTITPDGGSATTISSGSSLDTPLSVTVGAQTTSFALTDAGHITNLQLVVTLNPVLVNIAYTGSGLPTTAGFGSFSGQTFTTGNGAGMPGVTITADAGVTIGEQTINSANYGNCFKIVTDAADTDYKITLTAPTGYVIIGYSMSCSANTKDAAHTLTSADGSVSVVASAPPYNNPNGPKPFEVTGLETQSTYFTINTANKGNTLYLPAFNISIVSEGTKMVNVTYELYESDRTTMVSSVVEQQEAGSNLVIPASLTSNNYYDYATEGTIGTEDCTIKVIRTLKSGIVYPITNLSNSKAYKLKTDRGYLGTNGTQMVSTFGTDYSASNFAIISYENYLYLYSVADNKFVSHKTQPTLTQDLSEVTPISLTLTSVPYYYMGMGSNGVNVSNYETGIVVNSWTTLDPGNQYVIEEAADFDPTDAIAALNAYFHPNATVKYVISDNNGVALTSNAILAEVGATIRELPSAYQRAFCSYSEINHTIVAGENTINVTVTYDLPFTEGKWYYMTLRGHYVYYNSAANDVRTNQSTKEQAPIYMWGFTGNPYTGIKVQNRQTETYLTNTSNTVQLTENGFAWTIDRLNDTSTFGLKSSANYINEQNHSNHNLIYWSNFTDDYGSQFSVEEVPNDLINVTYQVVLDGQTLLTAVKSHAVGEETVIPEEFERDYTTYTLDVAEITATTTTVTATPAFSNLPFQVSTDYDNAKWYYLYGHSSYNGSGLYTDEDEIKWQQGVRESTDEYKWAFIGNPIEGFKLINKASGNGKYMQGTNPVGMGTTEKAWILKKQTNTNYQSNGQGFGLWDATLTYINVRSSIGNLQYWTNLDQGSTFWTEEVPEGEALFNQMIAQLEAYPYGTGVNKYSLIVEESDYTSQISTIISGLKTQGFSEENLAAAQALIEGTSLNLPKAGFYRIKGKTSGQYLAAGFASNNKFAMSDATDATTIFYFDGVKLTNLGSGMCNGMTTSVWAWVTVDDASTIEFLDGQSYGGYVVRSAGSTGACFYDNADNSGSADRGGNLTINANTNPRYTNWYLEAVTELPLTLSEAADGSFYATLCLPYDATIAGATAYTITKDEGALLKKTEVEGTIDAGKPVMLVGTSATATATLGTATTQNPVTNGDLAGTFDAIALNGTTNYALDTEGTKVGFIHWEGTVMPGFRAYIAGDESSTIEGYYFELNQLVGDVNGDGGVTIADVTALVNIILGKDNVEPYQYNHDAADVNGDESVTIADVTALVNIILGKTN